MARKFLLQDIAENLSAREGITKRKAELFLRAFFELTEEGVLRDSFVKVTHFGTTKLVEVSPRESVNVNTGERIQIDGHTKVSFTPDNLLRSLVNRPFELFTTALLHDDTTEAELDAVDTAQEKTIKEKEAEKTEQLPQPDNSSLSKKAIAATHSNNSPTKEERSTLEEDVVFPASTLKDEEAEGIEKETSTPITRPEEAPCQSRETGILNDDKNYKKTAEIDIETESQTILTPSTSIATSSSGVTNIKGLIIVKTEKTEKDAATKVINKWMISCVVLFVLLMTAIGYIIGFQLGQNTARFSNSTNATQQVTSRSSQQRPTTTSKQEIQTKTTTQQEIEAQQPKTTSSTQPISVPPVQATEVSQKPTLSPTQEELEKSKRYQQMPKGSYLIVGTLSTHVLKPGDNLYRLSKQIYGDKAFTRYVILYNGLQNPDLITIGQTIKFPKLVEKAQ